MTDEKTGPHIQSAFREALNRFRADAPVLILGHNDADGLSTSALLARAFSRHGTNYQVRVLASAEARTRGPMPCAPSCPAFRWEA